MIHGTGRRIVRRDSAQAAVCGENHRKTPVPAHFPAGAVAELFQLFRAAPADIPVVCGESGLRSPPLQDCYLCNRLARLRHQIVRTLIAGQGNGSLIISGDSSGHTGPGCELSSSPSGNIAAHNAAAFLIFSGDSARVGGK